MLKVHLSEYSFACFVLAGAVAFGTLQLILSRIHLGWFAFPLQIPRRDGESPVFRLGGVAVGSKSLKARSHVIQQH